MGGRHGTPLKNTSVAAPPLALPSRPQGPPQPPHLKRARLLVRCRRPLPPRSCRRSWRGRLRSCCPLPPPWLAGGCWLAGLMVTRERSLNEYSRRRSRRSSYADNSGCTAAGVGSSAGKPVQTIHPRAGGLLLALHNVLHHQGQP